jgi:transcriptional regulator with XRE-family HTH domain
VKEVTKRKIYSAPAKSTIYEPTELGRVIRARRKELGYTQEYIASMMGVSPRLIGEIEHGSGSVGIQKIIDLVNGLGIDIVLSVRGK